MAGTTGTLDLGSAIVDVVSGAIPVTGAELTEYTTTYRLLIPVASLYHGLTVKDTTLNKAMVYEGDSTTNVAADWRYEQQVDKSGAAIVNGGLPLGVNHIREHIALSTTAATFDFSATPIKAVKLTVTSDVAGTAEFVSALAYCIDPPNAAIRDAWLTEGTSLANDTNRLLLKVGGDEIIVFKDIYGADVPVDYIGIKFDDLGGTAGAQLRVIAVGVEA